MAEREHSVIYRAVAQFDDARKKAKEFRDELKALKAEQEGLSKSATSGAQQQEQAERKVTAATQEHAKATQQTIRATREQTEEVRKLGAESERTAQKFRSIQAIGRNFGSEFSRSLNSLSSAMRKAWREAEDGETAFQRLRRALAAAGGGGGGNNFFTTLAGGADALGRSVTGVLSKLNFWPAVILAAAAAAGPLVAILGSLGAVALGAGSAIISLAGSVAALPGVIFSAVAGVGALVTAISPLAGALKAYQAAQDAAGQASKSAGRDQAAQAESIRNAARSVDQAQHSVITSARSLEDAHHGVTLAARGVAEAEYDLADAQKDAKRAQLDINEARRDALEDLQDLRREVERSSLTEERAVLNLARAQEEYRKVMNDPTSSQLDRREATLRLREAENDLSDVRRENAENARTLAEEEKKGIEGSDKVVNAKDAAAAATKRQQDAEFRLTEAQRGLVQSRQRVAEAEYQLAQAKLNVADAERRLQQAQSGSGASSSAAATAAAKYKEALDKLSPAGQKVFLTLVAMKEAWGEVSKAVQQAVFEPVLGQLDNLEGMLPVVENLLVKAGDAIGKVAARGIAMVSSGPWKKDFADQAQANARYIENMGDAGLYLLDALRNITRAADPFTTWLTGALKEGAANFADWAESARNNGDIERFLDVTKRRLQEVWGVTKNIGGTLLSWGKAAQPFTDWMMERLLIITRRWREVARAQEQANSPLRKWLEDVKPLLTEVSKLFGDMGRAFARSASDTGNIERAIALLEALRTETLPALGRLLHELGESGVDQALVDALSTILEAIATFLDSGGGAALSTFVTVMAGFVEVLATIASLPVVSHILGGVATALAAIAAVSIVARFSGLFKLVDAFRWFVANRGNLVGALGDAARGVAGIGDRSDANPSRGGATTPIVPIGPIGSELGNTNRNIQNTGNAAQNASTKVGVFNRALSGIRSAGGAARGALSNLTDFIGGPWGVALVGATVLIGVISADLAKQKQEAEDTKNAYNALAEAYDQLSKGETEGAESLIKTDEKFRMLADSAEYYGTSLADLSGALAGNEQATARVNGILDDYAAKLKEQWQNGEISQGVYQSQARQLGVFRGEIESTAEAQKKANDSANQGIATSRTYEERLGGLTQAQVDARVEAENMEGKIRLLSGALDTLSSASATSEDRSRALADIIAYEKGPLEAAIEATEKYEGALLTLSEAAETNGKTLDIKSRAGLRNRDALQEAARATRDLYLEDIASGVPMDEALERHQKRIDRLQKEAEKTYGQKKAVKELIDAYGDIPENMKTNILPDEKGFAAVYVELSRLMVMQKALNDGKSIGEAQKEWNKESSKFYERYIPGKNYGDGYGAQKFATGGPVWGAGTRSSDSIRAWLSNGEFVQPTDSVDHYGLPIMEAIRSRKLDKAAIQEALPGGAFNKGGLAHGSSCSACASGGDHKYASGGSVTIPIKVNPRNTKVDEDWVTQGPGGPIGDGAGGGGWRWQMSVLRKAFPGLDLWSGYRPGSRTLSGNQSYHALGRAVDLAPRRDVAAWIRANYGSKTRELITPFQDLNLHNGKPHTYTGAVWNQHNFAGGNAHNHWAFREGGSVDYEKMFGFPGLDTSNMLNSQAMPNASGRQLSSAAQSVINQNRGITVENLNVNNPIPERASDSLSRQVTKLAVLGDI